MNPIERALTMAETGLGVRCDWYALCDREATGYIPHPILGDVPTCGRCHAKYESDGPFSARPPTGDCDYGHTERTSPRAEEHHEPD